MTTKQSVGAAAASTSTKKSAWDKPLTSSATEFPVAAMPTPTNGREDKSLPIQMARPSQASAWAPPPRRPESDKVRSASTRVQTIAQAAETERKTNIERERRKNALRADAPAWTPSFAMAPLPFEKNSGASGSAVSAEEHVRAFEESKRVWETVKQRQQSQSSEEETRTRRVWGVQGHVREVPLVPVPGDVQTFVAAESEFPQLATGKSLEVRSTLWPGAPSGRSLETNEPSHVVEGLRSPLSSPPKAREFAPRTPPSMQCASPGGLTIIAKSQEFRASPFLARETSADPAKKSDVEQVKLALSEFERAEPVREDRGAIVVDVDHVDSDVTGASVSAGQNVSAASNENVAVTVEEEEHDLEQADHQRAEEDDMQFSMEKTPTDQVSSIGGSEKNDLVSPRQRQSSRDFNFIREIGEGSFGRVMLIEHKRTRTKYAMKILDKGRIVERQNERYVMEERDILTRLSHPYIVELNSAFQSKNRLFLVMEFLPGGELLKKIRKEGLLNDKQAMFYAGQIILALDYLHSRNIVHRDLKPENILLDGEGHIRLTDFGLARKLEGADALLQSICGTDLYMAPEMLAGKAYGKAVDFWALGCVLYEMQTGDPPFDAINRKRLYQIIMTKNAKFPSWMSPACNKLLKGLLDRNVEKRLGAARGTMFEVGGVAAIKQHEFFKKLDWTLLERKHIVPPLLPDFEPQDLKPDDLAKCESFLDGGGSECSAEDFKGFSYVHPHFAVSPKPHGFTKPSIADQDTFPQETFKEILTS